MKTSYGLILLVFFNLSSITFLAAQNKGLEIVKTDLEKAQLSGKIKQIKQEYYIAQEKFGEVVLGKRDGTTTYSGENTLTIFDDKGYKIEEIQYKSDSSLERYKCNDGKVIEISDYKSDGSLKRKYINKYDGNGLELESNEYGMDGNLTVRVTYSYDDKGNMIQSEGYKSDGGLTSRYKNECDNKGNILQRIGYKPDGSLNSKWVYSYDENGNMVKSSIYNLDGTIKNQYNYKYDGKKNLIEEDKYQSDVTLEYRVVNKYDDRGNQIEESKFKADGSLDYQNTWKYEFDAQNNWTKKFVYKNNIIGHVFIREIRYYNENLQPLVSSLFMSEDTKNLEQRKEENKKKLEELKGIQKEIAEKANSKEHVNEPPAGCSDLELMGSFSTGVLDVKIFYARIRNKATYSKNVTIEYMNLYGKRVQISYDVKAGEIKECELTTISGTERAPLNIRIAACY